MRMHTCACTHAHAHMRIINSTLDHSQEAGDAARYTHSGSSQPTGQIMDDGGVVQLEGGVSANARDELKKRGHLIVRGPNGGGYQSITYDHLAKSYIGASEMRKDGMAAGY
mmetsp:Transcript_41864/g.94579  ORF Transcript_41864/g.94579 Transcript_41864/m.94579 type:complete len:111 (-) Transcript_41864:787-1119(-)